MKIPKKYINNISLIFVSLLGLYIAYLKYSKRPYCKSRILMPNSIWKSEDKIELKFNVKKNINYTIFLRLKYNEQYPYNNIFLKYEIENSHLKHISSEKKTNESNKIKNKTFDNGVIEFQILDEKTGKPLGKGIWKSKSLYLLLANKIQFPEDSIYNISVEHLMRKNNLRGIEEASLEIYR